MTIFIRYQESIFLTIRSELVFFPTDIHSKNTLHIIASHKHQPVHSNGYMYNLLYFISVYITE